MTNDKKDKTRKSAESHLLWGNMTNMPGFSTYICNRGARLMKNCCSDFDQELHLAPPLFGLGGLPPLLRPQDLFGGEVLLLRKWIQSGGLSARSAPHIIYQMERLWPALTIISIIISIMDHWAAWAIQTNAFENMGRFERRSSLIQQFMSWVESLELRWNDQGLPFPYTDQRLGQRWGSQSLSFASTQNRLENDFDHWDQWPLLVIYNCHHFHHYPCFGLAGVTAMLSTKIPLTRTGPRGQTLLQLPSYCRINTDNILNIKQIFSKLIGRKYFFPFLSSLSSLS